MEPGNTTVPSERKNRPHHLRIVVGGLILLAAIAWAYTRILYAPDPNRRTVLGIVQTNNWHCLSDNAELKMLIALGPKALPTLSELIGHRETAFERQSRKRWPRLSIAIKNQLPAPLDYEKLRGTTVQIVYEISSAACRALTSVLCYALKDLGPRQSQSCPGQHSHYIDALIDVHLGRN